jgi:ubiquinone/menaquinone biosynthesis C-methylase UbiE
MDNKTKDAYYFKDFARRLKFPKKTYNLNILRFIDGFISRLPAGSRVLDASCGDGYLSSLYLDRHRVYGLDCEEEAISYCARAYQGGNYFLADVYNIPARDNSFDGIILSMAIEHYLEPAKALAELKRVMKKDGIVVLTTPNEDNLLWKLIKHIWFRFFEGACKPYRKDIHPSPFKKKQLYDLVSSYLPVKDFRLLTLGTTLALAAKK